MECETLKMMIEYLVFGSGDVLDVGLILLHRIIVMVALIILLFDWFPNHTTCSLALERILRLMLIARKSAQQHERVSRKKTTSRAKKGGTA